MQAAVELHNVTLSYARRPAVHHVSGTIAPGSLTAIAGPNGAGKSTLLKAIAGLKVPDSGRITLGIPPARTAYLPQASEVGRDFPLNVQHLVAMGAWRKSGAWGRITPPLQAAASHAIEAVGLQGLEKRSLSSLSLGQFQRALFARLMLQDAQLILLDEPFSAVDAATTLHLLALINRWHQEKRTVICVLHDFSHILAHFPDCLLIARECVAWGPSTEALCPANLERAQRLQEMTASSDEICSGPDVYAVTPA